MYIKDFLCFWSSWVAKGTRFSAFTTHRAPREYSPVIADPASPFHAPLNYPVCRISPWETYSWTNSLTTVNPAIGTSKHATVSALKAESATACLTLICPTSSRWTHPLVTAVSLLQVCGAEGHLGCTLRKLTTKIKIWIRLNSTLPVWETCWVAIMSAHFIIARHLRNVNVGNRSARS